MKSPEEYAYNWKVLCANGKRSKAIDEAYEVIEEAIISESFDRIRQFCKIGCEIAEGCESVSISILTIGHSRIDHLRDDLKMLYEAIHAALTQKHDAEYAIDALKGLEV